MEAVTPISMVMVEISSINNAGEGVEEIFLPNQATEGEMPPQTGFLQGTEGKLYTCTSQDPIPFLQKNTEYFWEIHQPKEKKSFDPEVETNHLSYKDRPFTWRKELQTQKSEKQGCEEKKENQPHTFVKTTQAAKQSLQTPRHHPLNAKRVATFPVA